MARAEALEGGLSESTEGLRETMEDEYAGEVGALLPLSKSTDARVRACELAAEASMAREGEP